MNYSTIAIGDELLIGQVTDTNSGWMARKMELIGWQQHEVLVVADEAEAISEAIDRAFSHVDVILMTGGLGPTKDDITKPELCRYFGTSLVYDETTARNVAEVMARRNLELNDYTRAQAMVPADCTVIQNRVGTAPIMWFERDGKVLVSMPGVPHEMRTMMECEVMPRLERRFPHDFFGHRTVVVAGISESLLAMRLDQFERSLPTQVKLAYLPYEGIIRLRLTGSGPEVDDRLLDRLANDLQDRLGTLVIASEDKPLAAIVGDALRAKGLTLATAESCTGGNIAHEITSVAGSSDYFMGSVVSYSNAMKMGLLGVNSDDIAKFGVVSQPVVEQMTAGACAVCGTTCAVATSGIAGPGGGTPDKPVGTVWMAARWGDKVVSQVRRLPGDRLRVINRATTDALLMLLRLISER